MGVEVVVVVVVVQRGWKVSVSSAQGGAAVFVGVGE